MLWMIAIGLIALWVIGALTSHTMGGFINILPAVAVVALVIWAIQAVPLF